MIEPVVVRLKPGLGGRLAARAKRLNGFTRKVGSFEQVLADLKTALARADLSSVEKTRFYIYLDSMFLSDATSTKFYSAIGEIVPSGHDFQVCLVTHHAGGVREPQVFKDTELQPRDATFRARLAADWVRNAAAAPLILATGGVGGGIAAVAGLASFWAAAPVTALASLLTLSLIFTAVSRV